MNKISRSQEWFGRKDKAGFINRSWLKNQGIPNDYFDGRPVIGICNTWSELTPCNAHLRDLADYVKHGVLEAGGVAFEFPVMSLGESLMKPTTMLFRNRTALNRWLMMLTLKRSTTPNGTCFMSHAPVRATIFW